MDERYNAVDGLRAYAALGIVLMHINSNTNYNIEGFVYNELIPSCTNLVFLFMIISGFALCCGYYVKIIEQKISFEEFYSKRYRKIWPFFAFLCVIDFVISPSIDSVYEIFANLTLCFGLLPNAQISVIGVGWFLGTVFVFYLIFPFFCYLISNKKRAWFSLFIALIFNFVSDFYFDAGRSNIVYCAVFFLAGGLIYIYRETLVKISKKTRWALLFICLLLTTLYYIINVTVIFMVILYSAYLVYAIGLDKKGILLNPITKFLSNISLEIYLSHMVIFRLLEKIQITTLFGNGMVSYIANCFLVLVGTVIFAVTIRFVFRKVKNIVKNKKFNI